MTQEKLKRIVIASVAAATTLIVFLVGVIVYQIVSISVLNHRIDRKEQEIQQAEETLQKEERDLDWYLSDLYKEKAAREKGYIEGMSGQKTEQNP